MGHQKGFFTNFYSCNCAESYFAITTTQVRDKTLQDKSAAELIIQRLKSTNVIVPFAEIARCAKEEGRKDLASLVRVHCNEVRLYILTAYKLAKTLLQKYLNVVVS